MPKGLMSTACQMILAGLLMFLVAFARGERVHGPVSGKSLGALGYLIVFGSLIAFSAYGFVLRATRPLIATSYAYVNPLVALAIGAALGGEPLSARKLGACALTVVGVLAVTLARQNSFGGRVEPVPVPVPISSAEPRATLPPPR
jgi:drug/metabolite transporter (DMT)-like permease